MPTYDFECEECEDIQEEFFTMKQVPSEVVCDSCGGRSKKKFPTPMINNCDNVRMSRNLGYSPIQLNNPAARAEIDKHHPGAVYDEKGRMEIRNRADKLRRIKEKSKATGQTLVEDN